MTGRKLLLLGAVAVPASLGACGSGNTRDTDRRAAEALALRLRADALGESLRVARSRAARESVEKDLLVQEVHGFDAFMVQLQSELARIRRLEGETRALEPGRDPLSAMESERSRILEEARAARLRLAHLELAAERQGRQLNELRDSLRNAADSVLSASGAQDSSRLALASVRLLVHELRGRIDDLQLQVDSLTSYSRALDTENRRLAAAIAADAARDSVVHYVVGTRSQLLDWKLAREVGGMPMTGWGRVMQAAELRDTSRFTNAHLRSHLIALEPGREYRILTGQDPSALDTPLAADGTFRGPLRIRDPGAFWAAGKWLIILAR